MTTRAKTTPGKTPGKTRSTGAATTAAARLRNASTRLRESATSARIAASDAYATARDRTGETIRQNPFSAILGGIAIGALLGALVPRSRGEKTYLGKIGAKVNDSARKADAAGREKLGEIGLNSDNATAAVGDMIDRAASAIAPGEKAQPKARRTRRTDA